MIAMYLATVEFIRALRRALQEPGTQALLLTTLVVVTGGTLFYATQERWPLLDSLYFTMVTLMTIGYGDLHPTTPLTKAFTVVYALVGIGLVASTVATLAVALTKSAAERAGRRHHRFGRASLPVMAAGAVEPEASTEPTEPTEPTKQATERSEDG